MDDVFCGLLIFTSRIIRRLFRFLKTMFYGDYYTSESLAATCSEQLEVSSSHSISSSICDDSSSSSQHYDSSTVSLLRGSCDEESRVKPRHELVDRSYRYQGFPCIFQGLTLPILGLTNITQRIIRDSQVQTDRMVLRIRRTLQGSSDDIGWLQHMPGAAPVEDGTERFSELLQDIRNGKHSLPDSFIYLLIPGLFSNHGPLYFVNTKDIFSKMGLACHIAKVHSESSVEHNAWELKQYVEELYWGSGKRVVLLGHSKGGVDAAAALSLYWCDLKDKVAGLALVQSPYGGTPIASDILREGQIADRETRRIIELLICKLIKGDLRAVEDLTYEKRKEFITNHKLPEDIPLVSFYSEVGLTPSILATMSHVAHAELPWLSLPRFRPEVDDSMEVGPKLPVLLPSSAIMAMTALHLQLRYGEKSDGLVTCRDAEVPGSVVIRPKQKLDHTWMVFSSWNNGSSEPNACEMCEGILTLLVELEQRKQNKLGENSEVV